MFKIKIFFIFLLIFKLCSSSPNCQDKKNNCEKCNPLTNLCIKCQFDNYFPDEEGGCEPKCVLGKNYCNLCSEDETLCISCDPGYHPDIIGGCSYSDNCQTSYKGKCLTCIDEYILIQESGFCKSIHSEDLKNCLTISNVNGTCLECKDGYFLNEGDSKCTNTEFCFESIYGVCTLCIGGYYIDKKNDKCIKAEIVNCKQTIDGINCDECNDNFYLADNYQCTEANMCSKAEKGICMECKKYYYLADNGMCTQEENCQTADKDTGACTACKIGFYFDNINKICKSNKENEELFHCKKAQEMCIECETGYYLGEDSKCTNTQNCVESDKGECLECKAGYLLAEDKKCTTTENCKISTDNIEAPCEECIDGYYLNIRYYTCIPIKNETFNHCKKAHYFGNFCLYCESGYYNNRSDGMCYENTDENSQFYKCNSTEIKGERCYECEKGYYIDKGDWKCSQTEYCKYSKKYNDCLECEEGYCLDVKNQTCESNEYIDDIQKLIYLACNRTNEEGTACEKCLDGYEVGEEGYCIDVGHCEKKEGDICAKCETEYYNHGLVNYYCYNSIFGCIRTYIKGCLKCENLTDLFDCTECEEGYHKTEYGNCKEN